MIRKVSYFLFFRFKLKKTDRISFNNKNKKAPKNRGLLILNIKTKV